MDKKMKICEIENELYTAKINLSRGANCISLRDKKYKARILREPDYRKELENPYLYGMPVLFPANRISGGRFIFEGREYKFPVNEKNTGCHLHGILDQKEFQVINLEKDKITCMYHAFKNQLYPGYMHEFEFIISYQVSDHGLEQKIEIKNLSQQNMPVILGFHTTFMLSYLPDQNLEDIQVFADVSDEIERDMHTYLPTGKILAEDIITKKLQNGHFNPFEQKISRHYKIRNDGRMCIWNSKKKVGILYENSENMKFRLIYNGNGQEYICMEPQNCLVNCMNIKSFQDEYTGFSFIKPGDSWRCWSKMQIIESAEKKG